MGFNPLGQCVHQDGSSSPLGTHQRGCGAIRSSSCWVGGWSSYSSYFLGSTVCGWPPKWSLTTIIIRWTYLSSSSDSIPQGKEICWTWSAMYEMVCECECVCVEREREKSETNPQMTSSSTESQTGWCQVPIFNQKMGTTLPLLISYDMTSSQQFGTRTSVRQSRNGFCTFIPSWGGVVRFGRFPNTTTSHPKDLACRSKPELR